MNIDIPKYYKMEIERQGRLFLAYVLCYNAKNHEFIWRQGTDPKHHRTQALAVTAARLKIKQHNRANKFGR